MKSIGWIQPRGVDKTLNIKIPSLLPVISDYIFKLIFGDQRNVDILAEFLKSVLDIPDSEYDRITVVDPHVKKESHDDKYGILDVKVHTKNGNVIHVEIQVWPMPEMKHRSVYFYVQNGDRADDSRKKSCGHQKSCVYNNNGLYTCYRERPLPQPIPLPLRQGRHRVYKPNRNKHPGAFQATAKCGQFGAMVLDEIYQVRR